MKKKLLFCAFNMDTACVELKYSDGSMIAIDCDEVEYEVANNLKQRTELNYLVYNDPDVICRDDSERRNRGLFEKSHTINIAPSDEEQSFDGAIVLFCSPRRAAPEEGRDFDQAAEGLFGVSDAIQQKNGSEAADLGAVDLCGGQLRFDDRSFRRAVEAGHHHILRDA